jgi:predicted permease
MKAFQNIWRRLRSLGQRREAKQQIDDELRFHIEQRTAENLAAGKSPEDAARDARKKFGNVQSVREECRESRGAILGETLLQDIRFGLRMLRKNPGFTSVSVLSLAVGIAVNVTVFSCLNALLFRPPAGVKDPQHLVYLHEMGGGIPYAEFEYLRDHNSVFSGLAATAPCRNGVRLEYTRDESAAQRETWLPPVAFVSANYFPLIGANMALGRGFLPEEDRTLGTHPVVILSHIYWKARFDSDDRVIGRTVKLNNRAYTVVGVAAENCPHEPGVFMPPMVWVPFMMQAELDPGQFGLQTGSGPNGGVRFYGRLKPGATGTQAENELTVLDNQFAQQFLDSRERREPWPRFLESGFTFLPWRPWEMKALTALILTISGAVLLIACANVASLLLARATARQREMSVRLALGASRGRIVRQLVTESLIIASLGGGLGLLAGLWIANAVWPQLVTNVLPPGLGESFNFGLDWRIVWYALLLTLATGLIFGLVPALEATKASLNSALRQDSALLGGRISRSRLRGLLIVGQVAVSLVFLTGTTLLLRRVQTGVVRDYSFETGRVMMLDFSTPARQRLEFQQALVERIRALPGVQSACAGKVWYADNFRTRYMLMDGRTPEVSAKVALSLVPPEYFGTLGISIVRGRGFTGDEAKAEAPVMIVSESFASRFYAGDPIGRHLKISPTNEEAVIVGVAKDGVREIRSQYELQEYSGDLYAPLSAAKTAAPEVWVRTERNPYDLLPALRREVPLLDSGVRFQGRRLNDLAAIWVRPVLFLATTVGVLGGLALMLAAIGVYGVVAYAATQRTQEIGIRIALGARRVEILGLMLWEGMRLVTAGIVVGLAGAAGLSFVLRSFFYGLSPLDPVAFVGVSIVLAAVALVACYLPAQRATRVDPMVALRYE